jgi:uncharacterized protein (UPF0332 family)
MALGTAERDAAEKLITAELYREAVVHLYFTCYYVSQALLCAVIKPNPSHEHVETQLHRAYGRKHDFPRRYVKLHSTLHSQRNEFNYRTTHAPDPDDLRRQLGTLTSYVKFCQRVVPVVKATDLLKSLLADNPKLIKDFSFDIYCPKTYSHHTRLTFWQPPFYLEIFGLKELAREAVRMLDRLKVNRAEDYVVGLNSRVNQYDDDHLIMIDIDAVNPAVESILKPLGGVLVKSGRGYHFIGKKIVSGVHEWRRKMRALTRHKKMRSHVDKAHIEISLKRGYSTLRITASPVKPVAPYFYKEF